jgi:hypothetical protein
LSAFGFDPDSIIHDGPEALLAALIEPMIAAHEASRN